MDILNKALQLIASLSILIVFHEMGHFFFARLFKTRVEKFYLFFNPWFSLLRARKEESGWNIRFFISNNQGDEDNKEEAEEEKTEEQEEAANGEINVGNTEYGIGWLPLGGYVKIAGMIDESFDKEQMAKPPKPWEFRTKPAWQRLLIMLGGVMVNFILALLIYAMIMFVWGREYLPVEQVKEGFVWDSLALDAGLENGDRLLMIGNQDVVEWGDIGELFINGNPESVTVMRNGQKKTIDLPDDFVQQLIARDSRSPIAIPAIPWIIDSILPDGNAIKTGLKKGDKIVAINDSLTPYSNDVIKHISAAKGQEIKLKIERNGQTKVFAVEVSDEGTIGIANRPLQDYYEYESEEYTFTEAIPAGINYGTDRLVSYVKSMKHLFSREGAQKIGGFGTIGGLFPSTWDWQIFWNLTAFLSIILAFMNILPIPALDGGHVMFLLYEIVTGRAPGEKFMEYAQIIGFVLLIGLLLYANLMDVFRAF